MSGPAAAQLHGDVLQPGGEPRSSRADPPGVEGVRGRHRGHPRLAQGHEEDAVVRTPIQVRRPAVRPQYLQGENG